MNRLNPRHVLSGSLLLLSLGLAGGAPGAFQLRNEVVSVPEAGEMTNVVLRTDTAQVSFFPPSGWRMRVEPAESRISWTSADFTSVLVLQIIPDADGAWRASPGAKGREHVAKELAEFEVTDESACFTAGQTGRTLDLRRSVAGREMITGRVAIIPIAGAAAEVRLLSPASQQARRQIELGMFLNSFRASAPGKP